jgi:hypothetical protein
LKVAEKLTPRRVLRLNACGDEVINTAFLTCALWNATAVSFSALLNVRLQQRLRVLTFRLFRYFRLFRNLFLSVDLRTGMR